ncbi:hypothetical protein ACNOYE_03650 [Nannocystaceae bacterium ST9]
MRVIRVMRSVVLVAAIVGLIVGGFAARAEAASCEQQVCPSAGEWQEGKTLDGKARKKEAKANRKRGDVELTVKVADERGSVFVDGRYLAHGSSRAVKPGKHEIEVREGDEVIALGVLVVPRDAGEVELEVGSSS